MAAAIHVWSLEVKPGEATAFVPAADLRITNIALGEEIADEKSRTTVKLVYRRPGVEGDEVDEEDEDEDEDEDQEPKISSAVLCSLTYGKIEQASVDLVLNEDEEYLIELVGKNTVHLSGNYIDQQAFDQPPYDDDDDEESEDDYDLRDVSSDVEIDPDELDIPSDDEGRFEEIVDEEEAPKEAAKENSKKRPRESDAMETDEQEGKPSKSQKKKQKKLKAANGEAAEAPSPEKSDKKGEEKKEKEKKEKGDTKAKAVETKTVAGGVQVEDHKVGSGPAAKRGNHVTVRYVGKLTNGKVFDKNTSGKPFTFRLGSGEVIKGWDVGIEGMHVGGERKLTIPAPMAYGKKAQAGIPANSTLVFEVKLLSIGK